MKTEIIRTGTLQIAVPDHSPDRDTCHLLLLTPMRYVGLERQHLKSAKQNINSGKKNKAGLTRYARC